MRLAINQPYYNPYAGYFRLFAAADVFVFYDDVQFIKGGWIHRNKLRGKWDTLPIKKPHLGTLIKDLEWREGIDLVLKPCAYIISLLEQTCEQLNITCKYIRSSDLDIPVGLKGQDRVLAICDLLDATQYINAPGGKHLYDVEEFKRYGIELKFLPDYENKKSILERIADEGAEAIARDIHESVS